jgi:hypothetical protein
MVLFTFSMMPHVMLSFVLGGSFQVSLRSEVSDKIRDVREKSIFLAEQFRIKREFDLFTGRRFLGTMPEHPSMLCA